MIITTRSKDRKIACLILDNSFIIALIVFTLIFFNNPTEFFSLEFTPWLLIDFIKTINEYSNSGQAVIYLIILELLTKLRLDFLFFQLCVLFCIYIYITYLRKIVKFPLAIFFILSPFLYLRIIVGQLGIILAYLLTPLYLYHLISFMKESNRESILNLSLSFTLTSSFQPQFFALNAMMFFLALLFLKKKPIIQNLKPILIFLLLVLLLNAYWLQGFIANNAISDFGESHEYFYSPRNVEGVSTVFRIIGMWGFWRESAYITSYNTLPVLLYYTLALSFVVTMLIGFYYNPNRKTRFFFSLWWTGFILALGISHPVTGKLFDFLFQNLPFFAGFRDSHKFVALIALSYAYLCPLGITKLKEKFGRFIPIIFIGIIVLNAYPIIGLWGQVKSTTYPDSYFELDSHLKNATGHILYLPWQNYLTYNWTEHISSDGRIAVPINKIVQPMVIVGPDQYGSSTGLKDNITGCLEQKSINCLENNSVEYILNDKCTLYPDKYEWLPLPYYENSCLSIIKLKSASIENQAIPLRFILGSIISLLTLFFVFKERFIYFRN